LAGGGGEGPNRQLIGIVALGVILLLALVFLLTRLGGDDGGGDEVTPTATTTVLEQPIGSPGTPVATESPAPGEQPATGEDVTPTPRRGGDNQRNRTPESTPSSERQEDDVAGMPTAVAYGPVARACPEACLVRLQGAADEAKLLAKAGSRLSFAGDDVSWLVATPDQIAVLEQEAKVELVRESGETLRIYIVKLPKDRDDAIVKDFGRVIDAAGRYRLIEVEQTPARVRGLAEAG